MEVLQHAHDVLALAWRPDGKLLASATLDGQIYLWDPLEGELQVPARGPRQLYCGHSCQSTSDKADEPQTCRGEFRRQVTHARLLF